MNTKSGPAARFLYVSVLLLCEATPEGCEAVSGRLEERFHAASAHGGMILTQTRCAVVPPEAK